MRRALAGAFLLAACGHHPSTQSPTPGGPDAGATAVEEGDADDDEKEALRTAAIEQAMAALDPVAHQCWAVAATDDYQLAGEVAMLVTVGPEGGATIEVHADSTNDPVLTGCLATVLEAFAWPPPMNGSATLLPFSFTAPHGQNLIDRSLLPVVDSGARVLMDAKNTGNGDVSLFELTVTAKPAGTASSRDEVWVNLDTLDAQYLPAAAARAPEPGHYLIASVPGGTEDATRDSGVLPAQPASLKDKKLPKAVAAPVKGAWSGPRKGVGTVTILVEDSRVKGAVMSTSILDIEAGAAIPEHTHDTSDEYLFLLSGGGTFTVDGVALTVNGTSVLQIPKGTKHSFTASAASKAIQIYTPAGPEQRFKQK